MASAFRRESPVLYFRPWAPLKPAVSEYLLWPAWAWRVVAPRVRQRQLNVLQKAVLGLCRAGVTTAARVKSSLHLHLDLAAYILKELQQRGLLDHHGLPTPRGLQVLQEETLESHQVVAGYVFQDPWTGELWPRFVERLEYAELEMGTDGYPALILGTTGSPKRKKAWMHEPRDAGSFFSPRAVDVLSATRRHQRAMSHTGVPVDDEEEGTLAAASVNIDRVSMIDEQPQAFFLTTFLYVSGEPGAGGEWRACDPFGLGDSPRLRKTVEKRMVRDPGLRARVSKLLESSLLEGPEMLMDRLRTLRARAELGVQDHLSIEARRLPFHESLVDMQCALLEVEELGADCPEQRLREVLLAVRRVLEALFADMRRLHPTNDVWQRLLPTDQDYNRGVYEATARGLDLETPLPRAMVAVRQGKVKGVSGASGAWQLRPMVVAALLAARDDAAHPLRAAARLESRLMQELEAIIDTAGEAVHASGGQRLQQRFILEVVQRTWRIVNLLVGSEHAAAHSPSKAGH